ncbi:AbrB family transcriptional regulator [Ensifer sp. MJa1]
MLGTSFSPANFEHAGLWLFSLGGLAVFIAVAGASVCASFRLVAGFDHPTAFFSAMPGGLVEMVTLGAIMHLAGLTELVLPSVALGLAQVVIGATIGCRFAMASPRLIVRVVALSIGSTALLMCVSLAFAAGLACLTGDRFIALVLAYSPGGVAEMSLIALSLGIDVPFVVLHHIVRVFLVVAGSAAVFRAMGRKQQ